LRKEGKYMREGINMSKNIYKKRRMKREGEKSRKKKEGKSINKVKK
jgi:hypothetical protein